MMPFFSDWGDAPEYDLPNRPFCHVCGYEFEEDERLEEDDDGYTHCPECGTAIWM